MIDRYVACAVNEQTSLGHDTRARAFIGKCTRPRACQERALEIISLPVIGRKIYRGGPASSHTSSSSAAKLLAQFLAQRRNLFLIQRRDRFLRLANPLAHHTCSIPLVTRRKNSGEIYYIAVDYRTAERTVTNFAMQRESRMRSSFGS